MDCLCGRLSVWVSVHLWMCVCVWTKTSFISLLFCRLSSPFRFFLLLFSFITFSTISLYYESNCFHFRYFFLCIYLFPGFSFLIIIIMFFFFNINAFCVVFFFVFFFFNFILYKWFLLVALKTSALVPVCSCRFSSIETMSLVSL